MPKKKEVIEEEIEDIKAKKKALKKKIKRYLNKNEVQERQEEILKKYYDFDEDEETVTLQFYYESATDVINNNVVLEKAVFFNDDVITTIDERVKQIPLPYKIDIDITIDDYDEFTPEEIATSFSDNIESRNYRNSSLGRNKLILFSILLVAGIAFLTVIGIGDHENIWSGSAGLSVIHEMIDISGWVFIWQAVTVAFLDRIDYAVDTKHFKKAIRKINFLNKKGKIVYTDDFHKKVDEWESERRYVQLAKFFLLVPGVFLMAFATYGLVDAIYRIIAMCQDPEVLAVPEFVRTLVAMYAFTIVANLFQFLAGIGAVVIFSGSNKFMRITGIFAFFHVLIYALVILVVIVEPTFATAFTFSTVLSMILSLFFITGYILYARYTRIRVKQQKRRLKENEKTLSSK